MLTKSILKMYEVWELESLALNADFEI